MAVIIMFFTQHFC